MSDNSLKYQVFVSSTFTDLVEERMGVFQTLLDANCIPSGMESFAASPDDQFSYIKKVMDQCDYYVLIVGGRYGSCKDGISYTEKEYDYALKKEIPVLVFIKDVELPPEKKEETDEDKVKHLQFIKKLKDNHLVKFWKNKDNLCLEVLKAINETKNEKPAIGWIRGDIISPEISKKYIELMDENKELKENLLNINTKAPEGTENLAQDNDLYVIDCIIGDEKEYFSISWKDILKTLGMDFIKGIFNINLKKKIKELIGNLIHDRYDCNLFVNNYTIDKHTNIISMQLCSLGIIKYRMNSYDYEEDFFWEITPYGEYKYRQAMAITKDYFKNEII